MMFHWPCGVIVISKQTLMDPRGSTVDIKNLSCWGETIFLKLNSVGWLFTLIHSVKGVMWFGFVDNHMRQQSIHDYFILDAKGYLVGNRQRLTQGDLLFLLNRLTFGNKRIELWLFPLFNRSNVKYVHFQLISLSSSSCWLARDN